MDSAVGKAMDKIRIEVDGRTLKYDEKAEMLLRLERARAAIYGGKATVSLEPNVSRLRRRFASRKGGPISNIMGFGRKVRRSADG
jgi:hypothetical protein